MAPHDRRTFLAAATGTVGALCVGSSTATRATSAPDTADTEVTVAVGAEGDLVFEPATVSITPGTRVRFVWESPNHNIVVEEQPDGAEWRGTPDGSGYTYDEGYEHTHTFEAPGTYEFHCEPHLSAGEEGTIEVLEPDVTVTVGPGGELVFDPATVEVDPGDVVRWVWDSDNHTVTVESRPEGAEFAGTPAGEIYDAGHEFVHQFDVGGTHEYYCTPHRAAGMEGEVVVGEGRDDRPQSGAAEVVVGPGGQLVYDPAELAVTPGTTVTFVWDGDYHNVVVDDQPDGADWEGSPGGEGEVYDAGYEFSHTFETLGTYEYYCAPHLSAGMEATIKVVEPDGTTDPDDRTATDGAEFADGDGSPLPFSGPAVVGGAALAGGALARLRRRLGDGGED
jgi:plastocyanin